FAKVLTHMGVPVDFVPVTKLRDLTAIPRLVRYLHKHGANLVHTQLGHANTLGNIAAKLLHLPSVCTLHTIEEPAKGSKSYRRLKMEYWSLRNFCDRVITVSEELRKHHLAASNAVPGRVITLYNGIDQSHLLNPDTEKRALLRKELGIPLGAPLLLTVAVLRELKGIQYMLEALPCILDAVPETYYLIVGDGGYRSALEQLAVNLKISTRVIFAGYRENIPEMLSISDVFVLPTLTEALPTVLAEGMSAGLPIVTSAVGGIPEMVEDQINGILLPPKDPGKLATACIRLLRNKKEAQQMGKEGRVIAAMKFDIQKQAHNLSVVYRELLHAYG
ncbi:MAG TPA: glycosyltransferase family 4 protein, partial [Anaerolineales bacterium]|nr:glycosyltransferase family 4 protein [Anaerolineales bacterium]